MGPGHAECVLHSQMLSCTAVGRSDAGGTSDDLQTVPRMVTAESVCGLFWSRDFVSGHKAEIGK